MDLRLAESRTTIARMHITDASPQSVVTRDAGGEQRVYLRTPIGWRRNTDRMHGDDLVTDPALSALLDSAAADRER